jgi:hypothetical protein
MRQISPERLKDGNFQVMYDKYKTPEDFFTRVGCVSFPTFISSGIRDMGAHSGYGGLFRDETTSYNIYIRDAKSQNRTPVLPPSILDKIFTHLTLGDISSTLLQDLLNVSLVCKGWSPAINLVFRYLSHSITRRYFDISKPTSARVTPAMVRAIRSNPALGLEPKCLRDGHLFYGARDSCFQTSLWKLAEEMYSRTTSLVRCEIGSSPDHPPVETAVAFQRAAQRSPGMQYFSKITADPIEDLEYYGKLVSGWKDLRVFKLAAWKAPR